MGGAARTLLGGFGTAAEGAAGQVTWPSHSPPDLNQTLPWGAGVDNSSQEWVARRTAAKEKNWPALLILVIIALTVGGNILVILAVSLEKKLQNATNFFLRSLAVADMLVGILVMPVSLINILYDYAWPLPSALCPIWIYLDVLFSTASIMHLCAISLDRYLAIRNPIQHSRFNSRTKAMMKIAAVWTISIGVSTPIPVIGLHQEDKVLVNGSCVLNEERFMLIGSFVAFFIPLVIMVVTYCLTIQVLQRQASVFLYQSKTSSQQAPPPAATAFQVPQISIDPSESQEPEPAVASRRNTLSEPSALLSVSAGAGLGAGLGVAPGVEAGSQLGSPAAGPSRSEAAGCHGRRGMMQAIKNERRASKVLGVVFFLFLVMWCPFFITNVASVLCRGACDRSLLHDLLNVFVWVGYISSGVNPLVYTLFNRTYRRAFSSYIRCRYSTAHAAATAGHGCRPLLAAPQCPSHAVTPLLAGAQRHSLCRNGSRGPPGGLALDAEDATDDETQIAVVSHGLCEGHATGALSEAEPETEAELSLVSNSPASREHTSSV